MSVRAIEFLQSLLTRLWVYLRNWTVTSESTVFSGGIKVSEDPSMRFLQAVQGEVPSRP